MEDLYGKIKILKKKLEDLIKKYDDYFGGLEKKPPDKLREEISREIDYLKGKILLSYGLKFQLNQIIQRFQVYQTLWEKKMRARMEEEDLSKPRAKRKSVLTPADTRQFFKFSSGEEKEELSKLYHDFLKNSGEINGKLPSFEQFRKYISSQVEIIKNKYSCSSVVVWIEKEKDKSKIKAKPE